MSGIYEELEQTFLAYESLSNKVESLSEPLLQASELLEKSQGELQMAMQSIDRYEKEIESELENFEREWNCKFAYIAGAVGVTLILCVLSMFL